jgi:hypothetical protein
MMNNLRVMLSSARGVLVKEAKVKIFVLKIAFLIL